MARQDIVFEAVRLVGGLRCVTQGAQRLEGVAALLEGLAKSSGMVKLKGRRAATQGAFVLMQFHEGALLLAREVDSLLLQEFQKHAVGYTRQALAPVGYTHIPSIDIAQKLFNLIGIRRHPMDHTLASPMLLRAKGVRQSFDSAFVLKGNLRMPESCQQLSPHSL